ncbi:MAG: aspartyl protease family protein [Pseudomonadota bacterium]
MAEFQWAKRGVTALLALVCTAASKSSDAHLPLSFNARGLPVAEFELNGAGPYAMIVDTAAAMSAIDQTTAQTLNAPHVGPIELIGLVSAEATNRVQLDSIMGGPFSVSTSVAVLLDEDAIEDPEIVGLAGWDILRSHSENKRYIDLDFARGHIRTFDRKLGGDIPRGVQWTRLHQMPQDYKLVAVPVKLQGVKGIAILDTGINFAVVNSSYVDALKSRGRGDYFEVKDVNAEEARAQLLYAKRLTSGALKVENVRALVLDPPAFEKLGLADQPAMLLGANVLQKLRVVVDTDRERVLFDMPTIER